MQPHAYTRVAVTRRVSRGVGRAWANLDQTACDVPGLRHPGFTRHSHKATHPQRRAPAPAPGRRASQPSSFTVWCSGCSVNSGRGVLLEESSWQTKGEETTGARGAGSRGQMAASSSSSSGRWGWAIAAPCGRRRRSVPRRLSFYDTREGLDSGGRCSEATPECAVLPQQLAAARQRHDASAPPFLGGRLPACSVWAFRNSLEAVKI